MKKHVKILCGALALLTVAALSASCGDDSQKGDPKNTEAPVTGSTESTEAITNERELIREEVPADADYQGYAFRIQSRDADHHKKELSAEAENGETINDAVYKRNTAVEEKLNIKIVPIYEDESNEANPQSLLRKAIMASDDYVDLALMHTILAGQLAADGLFLNWYDIPYIDFSKPWWNSNVSNALTIDGRCYLAVGDLCISAIDYAWSMVFNKKLAENYDLEDIYQLVIDGKWTIDKFNTMISQAAVDLNGDGKYDDTDQYGFVTHDNSAIVNWMFALDQPVTKMNADGIPELAINTDHMVDIVNKVDEVLHSGHQTFIVTDKYTSGLNTSHDLAVANLFSGDQALFAALRIYVIDELRSMETNFGIIPFPKFDEEQSNYYTHVDGHAPMMCLPKTAENTERTGVILECLNAESYRTCVPAEYEIVLTEKFSRDEMSVKMLDIILAGRNQNFGYVYDSGVDLQWSLTFLMKQNSTNFASYYKSHEKGALKKYQQIIKAHQDIES
ncbi:MAG: hypothetical protein J6I50_03430 [Clostridia bacterium]|nr:hypothetical protein [Clostridia bacterium]